MRIGRGCLVSLVVLVLVAATGGVLLRWALDPDALRRSAETRLSRALGQPVSIGDMDLDVWPTPSLQGQSVTIGKGAAAAAPGLTLAGLRIVPRLSSIFSRPIVVERLELEELVVRVLRNKDGKWILPLPGAASASGGTSDQVAVDIERAVLKDGSLVLIDETVSGKLELARHTDAPDRARQAGSEPPGIRDIQATMTLAAGEARLERLTGRVGESTITGTGAAGRDGLRVSLEWQSLRASDLPVVFALLGTEATAGLAIEGDKPLTLQLAVDPTGTLNGEGRLAASKAVFGTLTVTSLASPLRVGTNRVSLDPLTFTLYGGQHRGVFTADTSAAPVTWTMRSSLDGVDVNALLSANTAAKNKLSGSGRVRAALRGTTAAPIERGVTGTIALDVAKGTVHEFPLLAAINGTLGLGTSGDDRDLRFDTLSATLAVANAAMTTDDLTATSGDLAIRAAGSLRFDLALDMTGVARFAREKSDELVRRQKHLGGLRNPQGELEIPFSVAGTAAAPTFSIDMEKVMKRAAGKELKRQLNRRLKDLIKFR